MISEAQDTIGRARKMIAMSEARRVALTELARVHGAETHLHTEHKSASDKHMAATAQKHDEPKRMGPPVKYRHTLALWIKANGTADDLAAALTKKTKRDISPSAVRSWYLAPPHGRPCPEDVQDILEEGPYFIPKSAWKNRPAR